MSFENKIGCILSKKKKKKKIETSKNPFLQKNVEQREGEIYKDISNFKIFTMFITLYTIPFHIIFFWTGFFTFLFKNSTDYGRITYRFSYTLRHIDRKSLITHTRYPAICTIFSFRQNDSFPKETLNVFWIKKANCIFEELAYL